MRNSNSGCLTAILPAFARIMLIMEWISRPVAWNAAFSTVIFPCLGFLFLPFTTLMYVWLVQPTGGAPGGIQGIDWLWLALAVFCDISSIASAGYANRNQIPGYNSGQTYTAGPDSATVPPAPKQ